MAAVESYQLIDDSVGLRAYVVVDSLVADRAMGGIRITPTVTMADVADLARQMSLKLALAELPVGGAKAGIQCALPPGPQRDRVLRAFGRRVSGLLASGVYLGTDQGMTYRDRAVVFESAGYDEHAISPQRRLPGSWLMLWEHLEEITGHGVAEAAQLVVERIGCWRPDLRVVVQGFGVVGRGTVRRLARSGAVLVAAADRWGTVATTDPVHGLPLDTMLAATNEIGTIDRNRLPDDVVLPSARDAWLDIDTDLLVLAAGSGVLHAGNVHRVRARVVAEGANLPCTPEALAVLAARGISVVPGIVANCGSATVTAMTLSEMLPDSTQAPDAPALAAYLFDCIGAQIRSTMSTVIDHASTNGGSLPVAAKEIARHRMKTPT